MFINRTTGDPPMKMKSRIRLAALAFSALTIIDISPTLADEDAGHHENRPYAIGLWGDLPYSDLQATTGVPNLIADMNSQDLAFTAHDGDLKAGNATPGSITPTTCEDALYLQGLGFFNSLKAPAIFTPGDNDWTDCDRPSNGAFSSLERLEHERTVFFSTPYSLGRHAIQRLIRPNLARAIVRISNGSRKPSQGPRLWGPPLSC